MPQSQSLESPSRLGTALLALVLACLLGLGTGTALAEDPPVAEPPVKEPEAKAEGEDEEKEDDGGKAEDHAALQAMLKEMRAEAARIRGKPWKFEVPVGVLSREELLVNMQKMVKEELKPEEYERDVRLMRRLKIISIDQDPLTILLDTMKHMIGGYYNPKDKTLFMIQGPKGEGFKPTLLHELIHALDDQYYDLETLQKSAEEDSDRMFVIKCVVEGSAEIARHIFERDNPDVAKAKAEGASSNAEDAAGQMRVLQTTPAILIIGTMLHYRMGPNFVGAAVKGDYAKNMDELFKNPPQTAEQILHPEKWLGDKKDLPQKIVWPKGIAESLGEGWKQLVDYPNGEMDIALYLNHFLGGTGGLINMPGMMTGQFVSQQCYVAAKGWDGGRFLALEKEGEPIGLINAYAFDSEKDAAEFLAAQRAVWKQAYKQNDLGWTEQEGGEIRFEGDFGQGRILKKGTSLLIAEGLPSASFDKAWELIKTTKFEKDPNDTWTAEDSDPFAGFDFVNRVRGVGLMSPGEQWLISAPTGPAVGLVATMQVPPVDVMKVPPIQARVVTLGDGAAKGGLAGALKNYGRIFFGLPSIDASKIEEIDIAGHPGVAYTITEGAISKVRVYLGSDQIQSVMVIVQGTATAWETHGAELEAALKKIKLKANY